MSSIPQGGDHGGPSADTPRRPLPGDGEWVAHCLDLDIVVTGSTRDQAAKQLVETVTAQIDYACGSPDYAYLYRPAPLEVWQRLAEAIQGGLPTMTLGIPKSA
jgi:hypothetical protein